MKKLLFLLSLLLLQLAGFSQTKLANIRRAAAPNDVLYRAYAPYNVGTYPQTTAGKIAYERAISTGTFSLTTQTGCIIPSGVKPPVLPPTCTNSVNWVSAWQTYQPGIKYQVAAASTFPLEFKFERIDGVPVSSVNPDYVTVNSGQWYSSGELTGKGAYTQQWQLGSGAITAGKAYRLTWRKKNTPSEVFAYSYTPSEGTEKQLFIASGNTDPPITPTAPIAYSRVFIMGNSISTNWVTSDNTRGLDASTPENDYVHKLTNYLKTLNPNVQVRQFVSFFGNGPIAGGQELNAAEGPNWEAHYWNLPNNPPWNGFTGTDSLDRWQAVADWKPDLIIGRVAENVTDNTHNFGYHYKRAIDKLRSQNQTAQVVTTTSAWQSLNQTQVDVSNDIKALSTRYNFPVADLAGIPGATSGAANHPNDTGMQGIADKIWGVIPKVTTTTTGPGSSTNLTALGLNGDFVSVADQGWNITTTREKYIESSKLKIGFLRGGAVVSYAARKDMGSGTRNLINSHLVSYNRNQYDFRYNTTTDDLGRQEQLAIYQTPRGFDNGGLGLRTVSGHNTQGVELNTGNNPVQGGNSEPYTDLSPILASATYTHPTRGIEFYAKTRAQIWGLENTLGDVVIEQWASFATPTTKRTHVRLTVDPHNSSKFLDSRAGLTINQEFPCMWVVRDLTEKLINITGEMNKNINPGNNNYSDKYITTDCRIGAYGSGTGVTYYSPYNSVVGAANNTPEGYGGGESLWSENNTAYIVGAANMNLDNAGIYETDWYTTFGPRSDADAALASLPGPDQSFNFDFSKENMLWMNLGSGRILRENGLWAWYVDPKTDNGVTSFNSVFAAPFRAWQASGIPSVTFEMAVTGATSMKLFWQKPGQLDTSPQFQKEFSVQNDGQFHTVTVSTSDANFSGIISTIGLRGGNVVTNNAKIVIRKIYKN